MHWRNSNFQIANFLAGKCHTVDEAYRVLCELREDRDLAIRSVDAIRLRAEAKISRARAILSTSTVEADLLEARADIAEIDASSQQSKLVYEQGLRERDFIDSLIASIQPLRKYKDLPDHEAHQMAQKEEWRAKLVHRAQTFLITSGTIPQDHLEIMMAHPDFYSEIVPAIEATSKLIKSGNAGLVSLPQPPKFLEYFQNKVE